MTREERIRRTWEQVMRSTSALRELTRGCYPVRATLYEPVDLTRIGEPPPETMTYETVFFTATRRRDSDRPGSWYEVHCEGVHVGRIN